MVRFRLISEEESLSVYYSTDNSTEYHGQDAMFFEVPIHWAQGIDCLIHRYPEFTQMKDLPVSADEQEAADMHDIVDFVFSLWERGLIMFDKPLSQI